MRKFTLQCKIKFYLKKKKKMNQVPQVVSVLLEKAQRESKQGLKSVKIGIHNNSTKYSIIALKYYDGMDHC